MKQKLLLVNLVRSGKQFVILQITHEKTDEHEKRGKVDRFVRLSPVDVRYVMTKKAEIVKAANQVDGAQFVRDVKQTGLNIRVDKKIKAVVLRKATNQIYLNMNQFSNFTQFIQEFPTLAEAATKPAPSTSVKNKEDEPAPSQIDVSDDDDRVEEEEEEEAPPPAKKTKMWYEMSEDEKDEEAEEDTQPIEDWE